MLNFDSFLQMELEMTKSFLNKYPVQFTSPAPIRMTGIVFARPSSKITKEELIPHLADWHYRSGEHIDFFFAGYSNNPSSKGKSTQIEVSGMEDWYYDPKLFNDLRIGVESKTKWKYSGSCDLLLTNSLYDHSAKKAEIDFNTTIVCQLHSMLEDKAIPSIERFFEKIFRYAESSNGCDPTWGFSDQNALDIGRSTLKMVVLSLLPKNIGCEYKKAEHFAVQNVFEK